MHEMLTAISTGVTAFTATNLDDLVILMLFFSQVSPSFRPRHIVTGQYLGFGLLILVSLPGCFSSVLFPRSWLGLLGLVPIAIGLTRLLDSNPSDTSNTNDVEPDTMAAPVAPGWWHGLLSPQTYRVAAITFANGGDNLGIYVPLFASSIWKTLLVILTLFFVLLGVWCYAASCLAAVPAIAATLTRYGKRLVPFVLVGLGLIILLDNHTLEDRGLVVLTLVLNGVVLLSLMGTMAQPPAVLLSKVEKI